MNSISVPEIYRSSLDFRFFLNWFNTALSKLNADTENFLDLYDGLRCPQKLLWMLCDTIGYKYDDRLPPAFCRLVTVYFMSMIRNRGSKDGITLAAEVNLKQFKIIEDSKSDEIHHDRLEDTSIPVNAVYVSSNTEKGYIDVVYFSTKIPIDACIEYVRPLGMYLFQHAGARYDARTKLSVDARLTDSAFIENTQNALLRKSIGPTHVGHYRRDDYARMQRLNKNVSPADDKRKPIYYRNSKYEGQPTEELDPGYRALYSLQLCNNENIVESFGLIPIKHGDIMFSIGYGAQSDSDTYKDDYLKNVYNDSYANKREVKGKPYNLRYDKAEEEKYGDDIYTVESISEVTKPVPAVNPVMSKIGDAIASDNSNTDFCKPAK